MAQLGYVLQSFQIYTDGFGKAGSGESCEIPTLEKQMEEFRGGGMRVGRQWALGYKAMTFKASLSAFDPQVMALGGLSAGGQAVPFSVRGQMDGDRNQKVGALIEMRGRVMKLDPGKWEAGKKATLSLEVALDMLRLTIASRVIWDIDIEHDVLTINGVDEMQAIRAALA